MQKSNFEYPIRGNPVLNELKSAASIEIDSSGSELQKALKIIGYAHGLFTHNGANMPSSNDPLAILKEAQAGKSFRCVEYSTLAAGLLWAYNISARTIGLKTEDVETREYGAGHVVIEFWSSEHDKWVMSDVQAGMVPMHSGVPLSAYELQQALEKDELVKYVPVPGSKFIVDGSYDDKQNYTEWIREYLYFIDTPTSLTLGNEDKSKQQITMLVPLGVESPKTFQGMFTMNAVYTDNVANFYQKPVSNE